MTPVIYDMSINPSAVCWHRTYGDYENIPRSVVLEILSLRFNNRGSVLTIVNNLQDREANPWKR